MNDEMKPEQIFHLQFTTITLFIEMKRKPQTKYRHMCMQRACVTINKQQQQSNM